MQYVVVFWSCLSSLQLRHRISSRSRSVEHVLHLQLNVVVLIHQSLCSSLFQTFHCLCWTAAWHNSGFWRLRSDRHCQLWSSSTSWSLWCFSLVVSVLMISDSYHLKNLALRKHQLSSLTLLSALMMLGFGCERCCQSIRQTRLLRCRNHLIQRFRNETEVIFT